MQLRCKLHSLSANWLACCNWFFHSLHISSSVMMSKHSYANLAKVRRDFIFLGKRNSIINCWRRIGNPIDDTWVRSYNTTYLITSDASKLIGQCFDFLPSKKKNRKNNWFDLRRNHLPTKQKLRFSGDGFFYLGGFRCYVNA